MRSKVRSSSPERRSNGCATGSDVIADASETDSMATRVPDSHGVYMVPAFVGLGAPHWDPGCARRDLRAHARRDRCASRSRGAGGGRLSKPRSRRGNDGGLRDQAGGDPSRRRNGRQQLDVPVPRRHPASHRSAAQAPRNHCAWRRLSRRASPPACGRGSTACPTPGRESDRFEPKMGAPIASG